MEFFTGECGKEMATLYVRTLIFSLVLSVSCVVMLWLSTLPLLKPYAYFWLTLAVGTLLVVIRTIISVYAYQSQLKKLSENAINNTLHQCPDYWTLDSTGINCVNRYTSPENKTTFSIGTTSPSAQLPLQTRYTQANCTPHTPARDYPYEYWKLMCDAVNSGNVNQVNQ